MQKRLAGLAAALAFSAALILPLTASASALTASQVSAILGLLQSFGADSTTIANVQASLSGQVPVSPINPSSSCVTLYSNTLLGSSGAEVIKLQNYLIAQGDLASGNNTGYFGVKTQAALKTWQSAHGISATGSMGPATRAAMACSSTTLSSNFTVSSASGVAPLTVAFTTRGGESQSGSIYFGDGNSEQLSTLFGNSTSNSAGYCGAGPDFICYVPHMYSSPGTYTAELYNNVGKGVGTVFVTVNPA